MPAIGEAPCLTGAAHTIVVRENDRGTQNWSCGICDLSAYAKKGTEAHRTLQPRVKRFAAAANPSSAAPPKPESKPAAPRMPWMPQQ